MKMKKIISLLTAFLLMCSISACSESESDADTAETAAGSSENSKVIQPAEIPVSQTALSVNRSVRSQTSPMGADGTWTVFVYMCGSDLESEGCLASLDIEEMMEASLNENIRYIVQTGGADKWYYDEIQPDSAQRWLVQNGEMTELWSEKAVSMGKSQTLADFLKWGVAEYPAENMGVILWNHGSGSISGICFDETADDDSLLLKELDAAFYSVYDDMTEPFAFIGLDACLMSTAEAAAIFATHADYMIASQETIPGCGWNYTALGGYLSENPDCTVPELGKVICDNFYADCKELKKQNFATMSVIDLSKIDALIEDFNSFAEELYTASDSDADFSEIARAVSSADNFGGNNRASGYTNMIDLAGLLQAGKEKCSSAKKAMQSLSDAVVYQINGKSHENACGLSVYYPLQVQDGSQELSIFKDVCLSPYYLGLVDKIAYGAVHSGNISDYQNTEILDLFTNDWSADDYTGNSTLNYLLSLASEFDYADDFTAGTDMKVDFINEPAFDEDGNYWFSLSEDSLNQTDYVEAAVYFLDSETEKMKELGFTGEIYEDWEDGIFSDNFDGYWFCLLDDQLLAAYLFEECEDYDIYISPVLLNGEETYLRFIYDEENVEAYILDIWDGQDENGAVSRMTAALEEGDIITPMYTAYDMNTDESCYEYGEEYEYDGDDELYFTALPDGDYLYNFCINDIYGNYYQTDFVSFTIDGEQIRFDTF